MNSYRRLLAGARGPDGGCWGRANRSALVRLPEYKPSKAQSARVEVRSPDSACNPYLAFAVLLAAGLRGIEKGYELPPRPRTTSGRSPTPSAGRSGYEDAAGSLGEALTAMEGSDSSPRPSASTSSSFFLRNKREEFNSYRRNVTPFELQRYLPGL